MAYEVRSKGGKYYVVDTATNAVRGHGYEHEGDADDRADELNFRIEVRDKLSRVPVTRMTAEEKAAAYDKMMEDKAREGDKNIPPKQEEPKDEKKTGKRSLYWGDVTE